MGKARLPRILQLKRLVVFLLCWGSLPLSAETLIKPELSSKIINTGEVLTWEVLLEDVVEPQQVSVEVLPQLEGGFLISQPVVRKNYQEQDQTQQAGVKVVCLFRSYEPGIKTLSEALIRVRPLSPHEIPAPIQQTTSDNTKLAPEEQKLSSVATTALPSSEEKIYRSSQHAVEIHTRYRNQSILPPKIEWLVEKNQVYEGENIPIYLILKERRSLAIPERIVIQSLQRGGIEEVKGLCPVRRYSISDMLVFDLPLASYFYTTQSVGKVALPQISVTFEELGVATTPPATVEVLPLPESVKTTNAVGDFSFSVVYEKKKLAPGDSFEISLVLEGSGNFNQIVFPEIETENLIEMGRRNEDVWHRDENRYSGVKQLHYQFMVEEGGRPVVVNVPQLFWYSTLEKQVKKSENVLISLATSKEIVETLSLSAGGESSPHTIEEIETFREPNPFREPLWYLLFLPGAVILLVLPLVLLIRRRHQRHLALLAGGLSLFLFISNTTVVTSSRLPVVNLTELLQEGKAAFDQGEYQKALDFWSQWEQQSKDSRNACLSFNQALASLALKKTADGVWYLRKAITLRPTFNPYREFYNELIKKNHLIYSLPPDLKISSWGLFLSLVVGFNLLALSSLLIVVSRKRFWILLAVLCSVQILISSIIFSYCLYQRHEKRFILTEAASLLKIPKENSSVGINCGEGFVVDKIGEIDQFLLVQNGLGITGWIEKSKVREDF